MVDDRWHGTDEQPKLHIIHDSYFSDEVLVKVKNDTLKGYYYMVAYLNATANLWFNPLVEEEINDEILQWKYIE